MRRLLLSEKPLVLLTMPLLPTVPLSLPLLLHARLLPLPHPQPQPQLQLTTRRKRLPQLPPETTTEPPTLLMLESNSPSAPTRLRATVRAELSAAAGSSRAGDSSRFEVVSRAAAAGSSSEARLRTPHHQTRKKTGLENANVLESLNRPRFESRPTS